MKEYIVPIDNDSSNYDELFVGYIRENAQEIVRCGECMHNGSFDTDCPINWNGKEYCNFGEWYDYRDEAEADFETRMKGTDDE